MSRSLAIGKSVPYIDTAKMDAWHRGGYVGGYIPSIRAIEDFRSNVKNGAFPKDDERHNYAHDQRCIEGDYTDRERRKESADIDWESRHYKLWPATRTLLMPKLKRGVWEPALAYEYRLAMQRREISCFKIGRSFCEVGLWRWLDDIDKFIEHEIQERRMKLEREAWEEDEENYEYSGRWYKVRKIKKVKVKGMVFIDE